ncbi:hypothetical protein EZJ19_03645 [Parasulfuritortus cantonensis]|uniref:Uncharacterized protein n=1 Tax=Parasulfuritortus cantonensis TaxID=2528202 RepID=A0A4R1BKT3_9PROT|nr:hypothetical protein [Parasulfuritortus cantonensis]TCJ18011.1 hypothetical protein EZJ19_03645 [Parasulfuritortus cantonensis]
MESILHVLIALLAAIAAFPIAAKARAEQKKAEIEYQIAINKLAATNPQNASESHTSNDLHFNSNSNNFSRSFGLLAVLLSTGYLAFLTFVIGSDPVTIGGVASVAQSLVLFMSGAYLMVRR